MNFATRKGRNILLSRNVGYQKFGEATLQPRRTETSYVPMQKAIKICIRNENSRRYRLRGLSVASRHRLRFHSDDVSSGSVMLYASTHREALGVVNLNFRHRASCILGQAFRYSPVNAFYIFNQDIFHYLIFAWPCIIDINNIDNQLDATITAY